ncbi:alpha/beta-hydrolase [Anaeramoeba ignava]|uniref:Alpha/beta-hydrolase n=1 Tax=Anaeramoeba ignava TaxID=1746090 RepID=A0A9Q0LU55_ANAIG|nr:alpha/beta-hydrolase [Anaeramoeba ignava]
MQEYYQQMVDLIIRPPRAKYEESELPPKRFKFNGIYVQREIYEIKNERGLKLKTSLYRPIRLNKKQKPIPCVIYCHGNAANQCSAIEYAAYLLPQNIAVLGFDFAGCGNSDGDYISLGFHEAFDIKAIVQFLRRKSLNISSIGIWGRSMGAVSTVLYCATDPTISAVILDSPFSDLNQLINELVELSPVKIPKLLFKTALGLVKGTIKKQANFEIGKVSPIKQIKKCKSPILFAHGTEDDFIKPSHTQKLLEAYPGEKIFIELPGADHNSQRPEIFYESSVDFLKDFDFNDLDDGDDNDEQEKDHLIDTNQKNQNEKPEKKEKTSKWSWKKNSKKKREQQKREEEEQKKEDEKIEKDLEGPFEEKDFHYYNLDAGNNYFDMGQGLNKFTSFGADMNFEDMNFGDEFTGFGDVNLDGNFKSEEEMIQEAIRRSLETDQDTKNVEQQFKDEDDDELQRVLELSKTIK